MECCAATQRALGAPLSALSARRAPTLARAATSASQAAPLRPRAAAVRSRVPPLGAGSIGRGSVSCSAITDAITGATDELKSQLKAQLDGAQSRAVISELLLQLEAKNPTKSPTDSTLITGNWRFGYNGGVAPGLVPSPTRPIALAMYAGGFSPGTLGLTLASMLPDDLIKTEDFTLAISGMGPYTSTASVKVKALGRQFTAKVKCELIAESGVRLRETYKSVEVYGRPSEVPASFQYERRMFISYLDEDLMVARDETGTADILFRMTEEESDKLVVSESVPAEDPFSEAVESIEKLVSDAGEAASGLISQMSAELEDARESVVAEVDGVESDLTEAASGVNEKMSSEMEAAQESVEAEVEGVESDLKEAASGVNDKMSAELDASDEAASEEEESKEKAPSDSTAEDPEDAKTSDGSKGKKGKK